MQKKKGRETTRHWLNFTSVTLSQWEFIAPPNHYRGLSFRFLESGNEISSFQRQNQQWLGETAPHLDFPFSTWEKSATWYPLAKKPIWTGKECKQQTTQRQHHNQSGTDCECDVNFNLLSHLKWRQLSACVYCVSELIRQTKGIFIMKQLLVYPFRRRIGCAWFWRAIVVFIYVRNV